MSIELLVSIVALATALGAAGFSVWAGINRLSRIERSLAFSADATVGLSQAVNRLADATNESARATQQIALATPRAPEDLSAFLRRDATADVPNQTPIVVPLLVDQFDIDRITETNESLTSNDGRGKLNRFLFSEWDLQAHILEFEEMLFDESKTPEEILRELGIPETPENVSKLRRLWNFGIDKLKNVGKKTFETLNGFWKRGVKSVFGSGEDEDDD